MVHSLYPLSFCTFESTLHPTQPNPFNPSNAPPTTKMGDDEQAHNPDIALPKATVNKFANEIASNLDVRLTADTRDLVVACCTEFVQLLSSEANDICEKEGRKTITPEHILRALRALGMHRFIDDVTAAYEGAKQDERNRPRGAGKRANAKKAPVDTEELLRQQELLFAMARSDPMAGGAGPSAEGAGGEGGGVS